MKKILFPTDFSDNARHALKYAALLANKLNANMVLLNIYSIPMVSEYLLPQDIERFLEENKDIAIAKIEAFKKEFMAEANLPTERISTKVEYGFIAEKIVPTPP